VASTILLTALLAVACVLLTLSQMVATAPAQVFTPVCRAFRKVATGAAALDMFVATSFEVVATVATAAVDIAYTGRWKSAFEYVLTGRSAVLAPAGINLAEYPPTLCNSGTPPTRASVCCPPSVSIAAVVALPIAHSRSQLATSVKYCPSRIS